MNQYEKATALFRIGGYFMPSSNQEKEFRRAKAEVVAALEKNIAHIKSITFDTFIKSKEFVSE